MVLLRVALALVCLLPLAPAAGADVGHALDTAQETSPAMTCDALVGLEIPASVIGLPTSGGKVTSARRATVQGRA